MSVCRTLGVPVARLQHLRSACRIPLWLLPQLLLLGTRGRGAGSLLPGGSPVLLGPQPSQPVGLWRQLGPAAQPCPQSCSGEGGAGGRAGGTSRTGHWVTLSKRCTIPQGWVGGGTTSGCQEEALQRWIYKAPQGFCSKTRVSGESPPLPLILLVPLPSCHQTPEPPLPFSPASPCPHCLLMSLFHLFSYPPNVLVVVTFGQLCEFRSITDLSVCSTFQEATNGRLSEQDGGKAVVVAHPRQPANPLTSVSPAVGCKSCHITSWYTQDK